MSEEYAFCLAEKRSSHQAIDSSEGVGMKSPRFASPRLSLELLKCMLDHGIHMDCPDMEGDTLTMNKILKDEMQYTLQTRYDSIIAKDKIQNHMW